MYVMFGEHPSEALFPSPRLHIMQIHKYHISRSIFHNFGRVMEMWDDRKCLLGPEIEMNLALIPSA